MAETKAKMSLKQRMLKARIELAGVTHTGKNNHSNYSYFELSDFIPKINKINEALGIFTVVSFNKDVALLTIVNVDDENDTILISSPMAGAKLPSCHEIQNLGAVESYQRRYLYMTAYEITEPDKLEQNGAEQGTQKSPEQLLNELSTDWSKCRTKLKELGKDVHNAKTNNWICTKAEITTQDVEKLDADALQSLVNVYQEMITTLTGGKGVV